MSFSFPSFYSPPAIDVICARCTHPFFTALTQYTLGPPPTSPPLTPHPHVLTRTERSTVLTGGGNPSCSGCSGAIGDHPSYRCAPCNFVLCDACARPPHPLRMAACLRTSTSPLAGSLRAGVRAAAFDCAACARPPAAASAWTVDRNTGVVPMLGATCVVAIGDGDARIVTHAPTLAPPGTSVPVSSGDVPTGSGAGGGGPAPAAQPALPLRVMGFGLPHAYGETFPPGSSRAAGSALHVGDLRFALLCDKRLEDLEDLGSGKYSCANCKHTVTEVSTWGEYTEQASAGCCIAARVTDPENVHLVSAVAVRGRA